MTASPLIVAFFGLGWRELVTIAIFIGIPVGVVCLVLFVVRCKRGGG